MRQYIYSFCILLVILSIRAEATNYTVKTSGGNYTTISACAAVAKAGDTCTIYAGSYAGWTQSSSGSDDANRITFTANPGDTVNVTSNITINNTSYVTISHLNISGRVNGNSGTNHCVIDHNTMTSAIINITYGETSYDNVVSNNRVTVGGSTIGITMFGDRNRIENNEIFNTNVDCMNVGGTNMVIRNNYCHDVNASSTGEHIDFIQQMGDGVVPVTTYSLIEHNVERNCTNAGGNCHFVILRANKTMTVGADGNIIRFNYAQNIDGAGVVNGGGSNDTAPNTAVYNNTIATNKLWNEIGGIVSCWQGVPTNVIIVNNISYNSSGGGWSPSGCGTSDTTLYENGDIAFTTGFSGSWGSPYSTEATYNTLRNLDPLFANYPTDGTLQSGSPARNAGANLATAVGAGTNSTSLTVTNVHAFQPGWAGANGDCIRVGASTTTCITSISYAGTSGTLTVSPAISWANGDAVNLYKDSWGTVVLNSAKPDIGAYPFGTQTGSNVLPPSNLQASVK